MSPLRLFAGLALAASLVLPAAAQQNAVPAGPLVTADWLVKNLDNPKIRVFEVSVDTGVYERGHIPGAVNIRWHHDLVDTVKRDIVSAKNLQAQLQAAGVDKDTTIVLYGDNNNWFAAWGAWVYEVHGIGAQVKLLDGGRKLWEAKGLPLDTSVKTFAKSNFVLPAGKPQLRAKLADVLAVVNSNGQNKTVLVDIRSPDEYNGKIIAPEGIKELSVRAGHIPGAKNVPWGKAVAADGTFLPAEQLKKVYADAGIDGTNPIITYCRIGERSSHTWFALAKILGYQNVKNYDGSWTEYGNAVGVPVQNNTGLVWQGK
ncbi:MAG: sulfurtransferase [Xanthobacteraceae bacterium]|nr:sulfurtransferase [Xanthobacteraceae bacterium]QYK46005.1 MAG: sulfurtransferase [Xanthobacteraceae bacterium]